MEQLTTPQYRFNRFQTVGSTQDTQGRNTAGVQSVIALAKVGSDHTNFIENSSSIDMPGYVRIS